MITPVTSSSNSYPASTPATTSSATRSPIDSDGVTLDPLYTVDVLTATSKFTALSTGDHLIGQLNSAILTNANLSDVGSDIDSFTSSVASSNDYESSYTMPSAAFLADLNALKQDAAANDLSAAADDLEKAKSVAPRGAEGAQDAGDSVGYAQCVVKSTDDIAAYLRTQGDTAEQAKAEAIAITLTSNPTLGLQSSLGRGPTDPTVQNQLADLASSVGSLSTQTPAGEQDPLLSIVESLVKSAAISNTASLKTLSILDSIYGTQGTKGSEVAQDAWASSVTQAG